MNRNLLIGLLVGLVFVGLAGAVIYEHYGAGLAGGEFNNTLYNATSNYVHLNYTDGTNTSYVESGEYTSAVIDFNDSTEFHDIRWSGNYGSCPENMSYIDKLGGYCIDQYEAYDAGSSVAGSAPSKTPWVSVAQTSARTYCINAGKHLCTDLEWLGAANIQGQVYDLPVDLSVSPYFCNTNTSAAVSTGSRTGCVSAEGVYDMVGNVWEWTNETVTAVKPCNSGSGGWCYPSESGDWQTATDSDTTKYGNDGVYFLAGTNSGRAVLRGGYWNNGAYAGPFCAHLSSVPSYTAAGVGFRCCSGVES